MPAQATTFKEAAAAKNKVRFTMTIQHKGNGEIYKPESICRKDERRANQNKIWIKISTGLETLEYTGLRDSTPYSGYPTPFITEKKQYPTPKS